MAEKFTLKDKLVLGALFPLFRTQYLSLVLVCTSANIDSAK